MRFADFPFRLRFGPISGREVDMRADWVAVVCGVLLVAASFSIAFIEGATAAHKAADDARSGSVAQIR